MTDSAADPGAEAWERGLAALEAIGQELATTLDRDAALQAVAAAATELTGGRQGTIGLLEPVGRHLVLVAAAGPAAACPARSISGP